MTGPASFAFQASTHQSSAVSGLQMEQAEWGKA